jgi:hypothetical protein
MLTCWSSSFPREDIEEGTFVFVFPAFVSLAPVTSVQLFIKIPYFQDQVKYYLEDAKYLSFGLGNARHQSADSRKSSGGAILKPGRRRSASL